MSLSGMKVLARTPEELERSAVLIRYRVVGGPVAVDQRLTVFENGLVELDERHRSRGKTSLLLDPSELTRLSAALAELPESRWSRKPVLALARLKAEFISAISPNDLHQAGPHFEMRRGDRAIAGHVREPHGLAVRLLDSLRVHAIRAHPR